ncbi:restriction endonuclease subunit S [Pseudoalteromonas agarivorans]|uniref:restriction endonuclease subunit S n=1 Tax=Pseudoalteromonas agarivorans TaxID=176102 RepID=UPI0021190574|nr:restriction endonuclease subunit S [Pseudoalteromonas agarivorans]MCQ8821808.1 restriction endonuclease subunit S [Pseudoalteromonas agarivorans]
MSQLSYIEKLLDGVEVDWKALEKVADIYDSLHKTPQYTETGLNMIRVTDIKGGYVNLEQTLKVNDEVFADFTKKYLPIKDDLVMSRVGSYGNVGIIPADNIACMGQNTVVIHPLINSKFIFYILGSNIGQNFIERNVGGGNQKTLSLKSIKAIPVPIPCPDNPEKSLAIQAEIVRILDVFTAMTAELTAELNMREKQYNYYRDQLLSFEDGEVEWKALGEVFNIFAGGDKPKDAFSKEESDEFNVPILSNGIGLKSLYGWTNLPKITEPSLTVSARGTIGWTSYRDRPFFPIIRLLVLTPKIGVDTKYAYYYMKTIENNYPVPPAGIPQLTKPMIKNVQFPIPYPNDPERSQAEQARIVAILDKFDALTNSITEGLPREIELRQKQYEYYRDLLLSFPKSHSDEAA